MSGAYSAAAQSYFDDGWSPIPLPPKSKFPPADDYTGAKGKFVDELTLKRWLAKGGKVSAGNLTWVVSGGSVALRLPPTVIGIDVDMYEGKAGRATFAKAIESWGPLPPTWFTSSRTDGSGIRLYAIPEGLAWPGKLPQGGGVELVRWDHRYAVVSPTIHPDTGDPYRWFVEDQSLTSGAVTGGVADPWGVIAEEEFPDPGGLPELPEAWVAGLTSGKRWEERAAVDMDAGDVRLWLSDRNGPELCASMRGTLTKYTRLLRAAGDDGGSHDVARDAAWAIIGDSHAGHSGVEKALVKLKKVFVPAVARRSDLRMANDEWARIVIRGVQKLAAEGEPERDDLCALLSSGKRNETVDRDGEVAPSRSGSSHLFFARTDAGNAERMVLAYRHEQKYVEGVGWFIWSDEEKRWAPDKGGIVNRRAIEIARGIAAEAEYLAEEDPKEYAEVKKFARASENLGKLRAMTEVARDLAGMTLPWSDFDADPARLGRVLLKPNPGVEVTPALPEHRVTMRLGCEYEEGAKSKEWTSFLRRCQPDPEIRDWLQRLVGYSLYGANPQRFFIVAFGDTSTGKTTFLKALHAALGDYAAMVNMTVYRDNQDDKPRPDLLRVLRKRIVMSEETSSAWHFHADQVKRVTGGAPLSARGMRTNEFAEAVPAFTPWIFVNAPPTIEGADLAVLRRLVIVPWDVTISKSDEDESFQDRICLGENRAAVLAWALEGWTKYAENPDLTAPIGTLYARQKFLGELSDFDRALAEIAVCGEEKSFVYPAALYNAYKHWCSVTGVKPESNTKFGTFLSGRGYAKMRKKVGKNVVWIRSGLRLTEEYERLFSSV